MTHSDSPRVGRRERNMAEKRERIVQVAARLFAERSFDEVTTQLVSDRADVAAGTLFRYAASKSELLLLVYNEHFRSAIEEGEARAQAITDLADAIFALVEPVLVHAREYGANSSVYQRELLFGAPSEPQRSEGLALVRRLEAAIARRLEESVPDANDARQAAATIFAVTHLAVARDATGAHAEFDVLGDLEVQIAQVVAGFLTSHLPRYSPGGPRNANRSDERRDES